MSCLMSTIFRVLVAGRQSRSQLLLENMALRYQLAVFRRSAPRPRLRNSDRWLWMLLQRCGSDWRQALLIVEPRTVIGWHRLDLRLFWRWKSRARGGRPRLDRPLITLIQRMWSRNPTWGRKRIQAELAKRGLAVADSTIRKYRPRRRRADQTWKTFLHNHAQDLVAVDFFTVPTATFQVL
jgi:hypothetical protein